MPKITQTTIKSKVISSFCAQRAQEAEKPEDSSPLAAPCCDPDGTWQERCPCQGHAQTPSHAPAWPHSCSPLTGCTLLQWQAGDTWGPVPQQCHHCPFLPAASAGVLVTAPPLEHGDPGPTQEEPRSLFPARAAPTSALLPLHHASSWCSGLHMEQDRTGWGAWARRGAPQGLGWALALLCPRCQTRGCSQCAKSIPRVMAGMIPSFSDWLGAGGHPRRNEARAKPPGVVLVLGGGKEGGDMGFGTESHGFGHPALWESWGPKVLC